jgi:hypothetical protein
MIHIKLHSNINQISIFETLNKDFREFLLQISSEKGPM